MSRVSAVLLLLLGSAFAASLFAGRVWLDFAQTPNAMIILAELRLPRALLALAVGGGLGAAGAAMQGYLRNPLADPGLFGIAPGAALGAVASFWVAPILSVWAVPDAIGRARSMHGCFPHSRWRGQAAPWACWR